MRANRATMCHRGSCKYLECQELPFLKWASTASQETKHAAHSACDVTIFWCSVSMPSAGWCVQVQPDGGRILLLRNKGSLKDHSGIIPGLWDKKYLRNKIQKRLKPLLNHYFPHCEGAGADPSSSEHFGGLVPCSSVPGQCFEGNPGPSSATAHPHSNFCPQWGFGPNTLCFSGQYPPGWAT